LPEWVTERGIGETRHALIEDGGIVEARIELDGISPAGAILEARLLAGGRNAVARARDGLEYLLPRGAPGVAEGGALTIAVTRSRIPGSEPWKRPLAKLSDGAARDLLNINGRPAAGNELGSAGWDDLVEQARCGIVRFAGGELRIEATAAMTVIDIDGHLPPEELAVRGAGEAARAIRRLDIAGSIGIDLPTGGSKSERWLEPCCSHGLPSPSIRHLSAALRDRILSMGQAGFVAKKAKATPWTGQIPIFFRRTARRRGAVAVRHRPRRAGRPG